MRTGVIAGNFDVIHPGYMMMFKECKRHCAMLYVLLHEDPSLERPEKMKPILSLLERVDILKGIRYIDNVISYKTEKELCNILENIHFDIRFLGDDYVDKEFTGKYLGIPIHFIERNHGWSTTKFKKLIAKSVDEGGKLSGSTPPDV